MIMTDRGWRKKPPIIVLYEKEEFFRKGKNIIIPDIYLDSEGFTSSEAFTKDGAVL